MQNKNTIYRTMSNHIGQMKRNESQDEIDRLNKETSKKWKRDFSYFLEDDDVENPFPSKLAQGNCWVVVDEDEIKPKTKKIIMKKLKVHYPKTLCYILLIVILCNGCNAELIDKEGTEKNIKESCEKAYFEGQRDAIDGDIRIKLNSDSTYVWTKSCWNSGTKPIYNPTYLDTKNGN